MKTGIIQQHNSDDIADNRRRLAEKYAGLQPMAHVLLSVRNFMTRFISVRQRMLTSAVLPFPFPVKSLTFILP